MIAFGDAWCRAVTHSWFAIWFANSSPADVCFKDQNDDRMALSASACTAHFLAEPLFFE
jgi:hypothetical protein